MEKEVYGQAFQTSTVKDLYRHRPILTPTNDEVDKINDYMLSQLPGNMFCVYSYIPVNFYMSLK